MYPVKLIPTSLMCYKCVRVFNCGQERYRTIRFCDDAETDSRGHRVHCGGGVESQVATGSWCGPRCGRVPNNAEHKCKLQSENGGSEGGELEY